MQIIDIIKIMDVTYRLIIIGIILFLFLKFQKMDPQLIRSIIFLDFKKLIKLFRYIVIVSPFFVIGSIAELFIVYPLLPLPDSDISHVIQDISLFIFNTVVIYPFIKIYLLIKEREKTW